MKRYVYAVEALARVTIFSAAALAGCGGTAADLQSTIESTETTATQNAGLGSFNVLTRNYNAARSGANVSETILTQGNVNTTQFGKVLQLPVDDQVYAQVLYASGVSIGGASRNVIYVATVNNSVYAFDADSGGAPLWTKNYNGSGNPPNNTQVGFGAPYCTGGYNDFSGKIGIVGTPVIDGSSGILYFVTRHVSGTTYSQLLHAIDIGTGNDRIAQKTVTASVPGNGDGSSGGTLAFNPQTHNQRAALALSGSTVYVAWAGHCDTPPYHGWVMAYNATNLSQIGAFTTTPNSGKAGIWMSGGGPVVDGAGVYYTTGNDTASGSGGPAPSTYGESVVKLTPGTVNLSSSFTVGNWSALNGADGDFGSAGTIAVPGTSFIFAGGKEGKAYLLNNGSLGGFNASDSQIPQFFQAVDTSSRPTATHHIHSSAVMWQSPQGLNTYIWGENDFLRMFRFNTSTQRYTTPSVSRGSVLPPLGMPGGFMALSASGSAGGTGILWATTPTSGDANHAVVDGMLRAFNAETLALLWDSSAAKNNMGTLPKYNPPVVAKGSVYMPSFNNAIASLSNMVSVYRNISTTQAPLGGVAWAVPGTVEAEKYDTGGANVAYSDSDAGNTGAQTGAAFRTDDVDIQPTTDTGGGFNVGWTIANEWVEYTVNVATAGAYTAGFRLASASTAANRLHLEVDGVNVTGAVTIPNTGGWQTWTTVNATTSNLTTGQHVLRVVFETGGCNFNWLSLTNTAPPVQASFGNGGQPWPIPGTIQVENYDVGGEGVAFHDSDVGNNGNQDRTGAGDNVDIEITTDTSGGFNVGWTAAGEWLEFTVNVASTGTRTLNLRLAATAAGNTLHVEVDGANVSGTVAIPNTAGWQTWTTVSVATTSISAGQHVVRVVFDTGGCNMNWFSL